MEDNVKQSKDWRSPFMTREETLFSLRITPLNIDRYQIDSSGLELVCFSGDAKRHPEPDEQNYVPKEEGKATLFVDFIWHPQQELMGSPVPS